MKLQEIAFMKNLIMQNYRRRMAYFLLNLFVIIATSYFIYFFIEVKTIKELFLFIVLGGGVYQIIATYESNDHQRDYPWSIKKRQMKVLREVIKNGTFEDFRGSVPMQEYFDV